MANLIPKTPPATWLATARMALIEEGIHGVKVDRMAQTPGGHAWWLLQAFHDRNELLDRLIEVWESQNVFALELPPLKTRQQARDALGGLANRMIEEDGFDPRFDLAGARLGRNDKRAAWAVERVDAKRIDLLRRLFVAIGCDAEEAAVRARVFLLPPDRLLRVGSKADHRGTQAAAAAVPAHPGGRRVPARS